MNTTSSSPAYLPYLNFTEHVGFLIAGIFAIFCNFRLLYYGLLKRQSQAISMSRSIYVLIFSHTALLFASLPYAIFMVWKKTDDLNELSAYTMYWTGLPANCYMVSSSIPIFFLTLDRCLSVKLSVRYNDSNRNQMFVTSIVVISVACAAGAAIALMELPLDLKQSEMFFVGGCASSLCLLVKFKLGIKAILGIRTICTTLNLILSCYFFKLLRQLRNFKKNDKVIRATVISDICLNIAPTYFFMLYNFGSGGKASGFVQFLEMFAAFDAAFCSFIFSKSFLRKSSGSTVIQVQSSTNIVRSKSEPAITSSVSKLNENQ